MLTKKLNFDNDVLEVLKSAQWSDDGLQCVLVGQLERKLYERTNKALDAMGGKWNRSAKAHVFQADPREQVQGLLQSGTLVVERDGFFETPTAVVERMLALANLQKGSIVLEPSAGMGAIAKHIEQAGANVFCVEKNEQRARALAEEGYAMKHGDFLEVRPDSLSPFDAVLMNPPFEELQDTAHVIHAYKFLKDGGTLVAIMGESAFFRETEKARQFREWLEEVGGTSEKLPERSFQESGTGVNCRIVHIVK